MGKFEATYDDLIDPRRLEVDATSLVADTWHAVNTLKSLAAFLEFLNVVPDTNVFDDFHLRADELRNISDVLSNEVAPALDTLGDDVVLSSDRPVV